MKPLKEFLNEGYKDEFYIEKDGKFLTNHGMKKFWFTDSNQIAYSTEDKKYAERLAKEYKGKVVNYSDVFESKKSNIKKGDKVKIKKEWLNDPKEADIVYVVKSNPNSNNRVDIVNPKSKLSIPGIESVKVEYLEKV